MIGPLVLTRMKQPDDLAGQRVNSAQVRPLVKIAAMAGESKIRKFVCSAVLPRYDMFDVMRKFAVALQKPAIFTATSSTFPNVSPGFRIHL